MYVRVIAGSDSFTYHGRMQPPAIPRATLGKTELMVSRLGLGTAEIGFAYGIGPKDLPSEEDALRLLSLAVERGITFFDTANYYGLAEERLGKSGLLKNPEVVVCTKCAQFLEKGEYFEAGELEKRIRDQVEGSLKNLGLEMLPLLLLHGPSAEQMKEGTLLSIVKSLQEEGKIRYWGASTRGEESPLAVIEAGADVIQVAFNIADRRMVEKVFAEALQRGVGVINRSVYLKGAFAGRAQYLPESLIQLKNVVSEAGKIADGLGVSLTELALRYTLSEPAIHTSLVGTAKTENLLSAAEAIGHGPLPHDAREALRALALSDIAQIDPAQWGAV